MRLFAAITFPLFFLAFAACAKRETVVDRGNREGILHLSVGSEPSDLDPQIVTGLGEAKIIQSLFEPIVSLRTRLPRSRPRSRRKLDDLARRSRLHLPPPRRSPLEQRRPGHRTRLHRLLATRAHSESRRRLR